MVAMFVNGSERHKQSQQRTFHRCFLPSFGTIGQMQQRTFHRCFLPSFGTIGQTVSEEKFFLKSANQKQESPVVVMFVNGSGRNEQSLQRTFHRCFLPSFGSFGQTVTEEKNFLNQPIRNKSRLWRPCLLTNGSFFASNNHKLWSLNSFHKYYHVNCKSSDTSVFHEIFKI